MLLGAPIANRNRAEIEGLIGFFLNTLVLRTDVVGRSRLPGAAGPGARDLPRRLRPPGPAAGAGAQGRARGPRSGPELPVPGDVPAAEHRPRQSIEIPGLTFSVLDAEQQTEELGTAIFEAGLTLVERPDGIVASITYNALLFDEPTILRLLARYQRLLAGAVADPSRPVWDYELMGDGGAAGAAGLGRSGGAAARAAGGPGPPALRDAGRSRPPRPLAVIAGDRRLTYAELNRDANRLAHHLRDLGVGSGDGRRHRRRALAGDDRRPARRAQGGRRLRAARPGLPGGPPRVHPAGRRRRRS